MTDNAEIAEASDRLRTGSVSQTEVALDVAPPAVDAPARVDETGVELKRGAILNTTATLASNLRGVFTFLVARLLGPAAMGTFSVTWANIVLPTKISCYILDITILSVIILSQES